ncbi:MAG: DUF1338 family protein [Pseudomonadota bacterium]
MSRAELAQALCMCLFQDLIERVPVASAYVNDARAAGTLIDLDHGALRTVKWPSGDLPPGEASLTRVLRALGYQHNGTYPLEKLRMTGRSWCHQDIPEGIAQFFVSELHPERFSLAFQSAVDRVIGNSTDPLNAGHTALLETLSRDRSISKKEALLLFPALISCFGRQHSLFEISDYDTLAAESAEMAWIATEGNVFNHATDRVVDVHAVAEQQRKLGRPIKQAVEISASGNVRQTAFQAAEVHRRFLQNGKTVTRAVPGSFYELISRDVVRAEGTPERLDLQFDAGNATGIFAMTSARVPA